MPSFAEIFTVLGVAVGTGADVVVSGVDIDVGVNGICICVGAMVAVGGGGVAVPWQAASKKTEMSRSIFFIVIIELNQLQFLRRDNRDVLPALFSNP